MVHRYGPVSRSHPDPPVVVDLGYGATPVTTVELRARLARVRKDLEVVGLEIDPERVAAASPFAELPGLRFARGGFELPLPAGVRPVLVHAFNVLRQYPEAEVTGVWERLAGRLHPAGALIEGTCDEIRRLAAWVEIGAADAGPRALWLGWRLAGLTGQADHPSWPSGSPKLSSTTTGQANRSTAYSMTWRSAGTVLRPRGALVPGTVSWPRPARCADAAGRCWKALPSGETGCSGLDGQRWPPSTG